MAARAEIVSAGKPQRPIVVKIAPDIAEEDVDSICARLAAHRVDGIAVSNTTLSRPELETRGRRRAAAYQAGRCSTDRR